MPLNSPDSRAAIVYLCGDDGLIGTQLSGSWCADRAVAAGLTVVGVVTDIDRSTLLAERQGWQRVVALASTSLLIAVVTLNRGMVAETPGEWRRLADQLAVEGIVLLTIGSLAVTWPDTNTQSAGAAA